MSKKVEPLIKAYGLHWKPEEIYAKLKRSPRKGRFVGKVMRYGKPYKINFWKATGIYALYEDGKCVYAGLRTGRDLGGRIRTHWKEKENRWDTFSFWCFSEIVYETGSGETGSVSDKFKTQRIHKHKAMETIEAIMIRVGVPGLNKQDPKIPGAKKASQEPFLKRKSVDDVYEQLEKLERKIEKSFKSLED
jgi:hypothetical protein